MPNHVHLIAIPEYTDSLSHWMQRVHGRYAQYLNIRLRRADQLFEGRHYSCVVSPFDLARVIRHLEQ